MRKKIDKFVIEHPIMATLIFLISIPLIVGLTPIIAIILPFYLVYRKSSEAQQKKTHKAQEIPNYIAEEKIEKKKEEIDYSQAYQRKYLLTKNEWHEYKKLKELAAGKGLQVCPKIRLYDLIEPRKNREDYKVLKWKIQAKHVDFVLADKDLYIKAIVELDDGSHDTQARQERDIFVDQILTACGYKVIRTRSITAETIENL